MLRKVEKVGRWNRGRLCLKGYSSALLNQYTHTNILTMLNFLICLSLHFRSLQVSFYKVKCWKSENCQEWGRETVTSLLTRPKLEHTDGKKDMPIVGCNTVQWTREDDPVRQPGMCQRGLGTEVKGGRRVPHQLTVLERRSPADSPMRCPRGSGIFRLASDCHSRWGGLGSGFPNVLSVFA